MKDISNKVLKDISNKVLIAMFYHSDVDNYYELRDELLRRLEELCEIEKCRDCDMIGQGRQEVINKRQNNGKKTSANSKGQYH